MCNTNRRCLFSGYHIHFSIRSRMDGNIRT